MDFAFSDEQEALRDGVATALTRDYDYMAIRDRARRGEDVTQLWDALRDLGVLALPFPAASGGLGGTIVDLVAIGEILGEHLVIAPYLASTVLAGHLLTIAGSTPIATRWSARIIDGEAMAALASGASALTGAPSCRARRVAGGYLLSGAHRMVLGGGRADLMLVAAQTGEDGPGTTLIAAIPARRLSRRGYMTIDGRDAADVQVDAIRIDDDEVLVTDAAADLDHAIARAMLVTAAESVGVMGALLRETSAYTSARQQFGAPMRQFQAVAHRLADMKLAYASARATLLHTVAEIDAGVAAPGALSVLKVRIGALGQSIGEAAIQLHGGVGMTDEVRIGHLHKRLLVNDALFGSADHHLRLLDAIPI